MPMQFPTLAEQALAAWRASPTTKPIEAFTQGAFKCNSRSQFGYQVIGWVFDDDSILRATGRGRSHQATAELP